MFVKLRGEQWGRTVACFVVVVTALLPAFAESPAVEKLFAVTVDVYAVPSSTRVRYTASRSTVVKGSAGSISDAAVGCVSGSGFQDQMKSLVKSGRATAISTQVVTNLSGSVFRSVTGGKPPTTEVSPAKWGVEVEGTLDVRGTSTLVDFDVKVHMGGSKRWIVSGSQLVVGNQALLIGSQLATSQPKASDYRVVIVIQLRNLSDAPASDRIGVTLR